MFVVVFVVLSYTDTVGSQSPSWPLIQKARPMIWPPELCARVGGEGRGGEHGACLSKEHVAAATRLGYGRVLVLGIARVVRAAAAAGAEERQEQQRKLQQHRAGPHAAPSSTQTAQCLALRQRACVVQPARCGRSPHRRRVPLEPRQTEAGATRLALDGVHESVCSIA